MLKFEKLIQTLEQHQVEYIIVGGLAAVIHGSSYITNDLDICYLRTKLNFSAIVKALSSFHPRLRGANSPMDLPFIFDERSLKNGLNFTFTTDLGDIDLLGEIVGLGTYQETLANSEWVELFKSRCRVISLPDLIRAKKAAGRKKDLLILDDLEALNELKKKNNK